MGRRFSCWIGKRIVHSAFGVGVGVVVTMTFEPQPQLKTGFEVKGTQTDGEDGSPIPASVSLGK